MSNVLKLSEPSSISLSPLVFSSLFAAQHLHRLSTTMCRHLICLDKKGLTRRLFRKMLELHQWLSWNASWEHASFLAHNNSDVTWLQLRSERERLSPRSLMSMWVDSDHNLHCCFTLFFCLHDAVLSNNDFTFKVLLTTELFGDLCTYVMGSVVWRTGEIRGEYLNRIWAVIFFVV